jgi:hypothetical protein
MDDRTTIYEVVNDAGRYMFSMEEWPFNKRVPTDLAFTADDAFIALPADFGKIISIEVPSNLQNRVQLTSPGYIEYLRGSDLQDPYNYHVAIVYPTQTAQTGSQGVPRLELWPTPGTADTTALRLVYEAKWTTLTAVTHVPNIPLEAEPLYLQIVLAFARSLDNPSLNLTELLGTINAGTMFRNLSRTYGMAQRSLGLSEGGIVNNAPRGEYRPFATIAGAS